GGRQIACRWDKAEVEVAQHNPGTRFATRCYRATIAAIEPMQPIIQSPAQPVEVAIRYSQHKTLAQHFTCLRFAIPILVLQKHNFRRGGYDDSAVPRSNRRREAEAL